MDSKGPDAFRTISEVAGDLDLPQHVLRFWETRFSQIKPLKRGGGRRYYRPDDIELLRGIRHLLYDEGYTIKGVQRILKERGVRFVSEAMDGADQNQDTEDTGALNGQSPSDDDTPMPTAPLPEAGKEAGPIAGSMDGTVSKGTQDHSGPSTAPAERQAQAKAPAAQMHPVSPTPAARSRPIPQAHAVSSGNPSPIGASQPTNVPRDILLDDPPAKKADSRSLMDKIRGVPEAEPEEEPQNHGQLSRDDIRRLQSTLFELLECKRILDRSRSG